MQTTRPAGGGRGIDCSALGLIGVIREAGREGRVWMVVKPEAEGPKGWNTGS